MGCVSLLQALKVFFDDTWLRYRSIKRSYKPAWRRVVKHDRGQQSAVICNLKQSVFASVYCHIQNEIILLTPAEQLRLCFSY